MAVTDRDTFFALIGGPSQTLVVNKASIATQLAGGFSSLWRATGTPGQGAITGAAAVCDDTLTTSLAGAAQTIAEPLSLAVQLYQRGTTTLVTTISVAPGDCTGWTTTSVAVPVVFTSAISAGLAVGTYNVEIVGTYVNGSVRWPENGSALSLVVRAPGAT